MDRKPGAFVNCVDLVQPPPPHLEAVDDVLALALALAAAAAAAPAAAAWAERVPAARVTAIPMCQTCVRYWLSSTWWWFDCKGCCITPGCQIRYVHHIRLSSTEPCFVDCKRTG
jgi:hypothetical protein